VIFVVLPLSGLGLVERFLVDIGFSVMLTSGALATHRHVLLTWIIIMLTIAGLVVHWMGACIFQAPAKAAVLVRKRHGQITGSIWRSDDAS
jgi:hypothetical protein